MFFVWVIAAAVVLALVSIAWVRFAPSDPEGWHVDPATAPDQGQPNAWRVAGARDAGADAVAPVYGVPALELAQAVHAVALAEPRTARLAGRPGDLWTTYIQRSRWMRFPDYISVRAIELEDDRSTIAIFSRARFGREDRGVNRARVERWLAALAPLEE